MPEIQQLLTGTKIRYNRFVQYINECELKDFVLHFRYPFLLGKELYDGELSKKTLHSLNATFRFQQEEDSSELDISPSAVMRAIFMLRCIEDEVLLLNNFTIGRHSSNDITIVDYSVSKEHALIKRKDNFYSIMDKNSTNGTLINGERLEAKREYILHPKDIVTLGRFGFMFMRPIDLFIAFRQHLGLEHTLIDDLNDILPIINHNALRKVASKNKVSWQNKDKNAIITALYSKLSPVEFLEQIF